MAGKNSRTTDERAPLFRKDQAVQYTGSRLAPRGSLWKVEFVGALRPDGQWPYRCVRTDIEVKDSWRIMFESDLKAVL